MGALSFIKELISPVTKLVDEVHTSEEERLQLQAHILSIKNEITAKTLEYETKLMDLQSSIIKAEAGGSSWLQRNWRPVTMVTFLGLIVSYWFGYTPVNMTEATVQELFSIIKIGLGGYVIGRSIEKTAPNITAILKK